MMSPPAATAANATSMGGKAILHRPGTGSASICLNLIGPVFSMVNSSSPGSPLHLPLGRKARVIR
jgi:hypothetical protein